MKARHALLLLAGVCLATHLRADTPIPSTIAKQDTNAVITWDTVPGKAYILKGSTNLAQPLAWPSSMGVLNATANQLSHTDPLTNQFRFYTVAKLDTEGPVALPISPFPGSIAVSTQTVIRVRLQDETGIDTNSITLTISTNPPVTFGDPRLAFDTGVLTYTPRTGEVLGAPGQTITASVSVTDTLGNRTPDANWSFKMEQELVLSDRIILLGQPPQPARAAKTAPPVGSGLTLVSTNGDTFIYRFTGASSGLTAGDQLVDPDLRKGYARTVVSFTEDPAAKTVTVLTRQARPAELIKEGSIISGPNFIELTDGPSPQGTVETGFSLQYSKDLSGTIYQDDTLVVETLPGSQLDLNATLALAANFSGSRLTEFETTISGQVNFDLAVHAKANGSTTLSGEKQIGQPIRKLYGTFIGWVPVWIEVEIKFLVGYEANLEGAAEATVTVGAEKEIRVGRRYDSEGWQDIFDNPAPTFTVPEPEWQFTGSAKLRGYVRPEVSAKVYSLAGVFGNLEPYAELSGSFQANPRACDLTLYGGVQSTIGLDLRVWDPEWLEQATLTFDLVRPTLIWSYTCAPPVIEPPRITAQPRSLNVKQGATATFSVVAAGPGPLSYQWQKNGTNLWDDGRISGARSSVLTIANTRASDAGAYRVKISNAGGQLYSNAADLGVFPSGEPFLVGGWDTSRGALGVTVVGSYAYVAAYTAGLQVINVSNRANPVRVGGYESSGLANGVTVVGSYAYVADYDAGLQIINVSNPANPVRAGGYDTSGSARSVTVVGSYAYVADSFAGLQIINVSNPANPMLVGRYDTSGQAFGVAVVGFHAYVADYRAGLQIIDVNNKANPVRVGGYDTSNLAYGVTAVGSYAYVADGDDGLQIIDVSNPANPIRVGGYDTSGDALGVTVVGSYAYVADGDDGLQIINVSNPANPIRVGGYDTSGYAWGGVSVVEPYAYVADGDGLQIINLGR